MSENIGCSTKEEFCKVKEDIKRLISNELYGRIPLSPIHFDYNVKLTDSDFAAGKATYRRVELTSETERGDVSFEITEITPNRSLPCPAVVFLSPYREIPNKLLPAEEIIDRGYAVFSLYCNDITDNSPCFKSGIARIIAGSRKSKSAPGKIALWAWAAIRIMDYVSRLELIRQNGIAVAGHGLLGKAALLAGGYDERFCYVIANDSMAFGTANGNINTVMYDLPQLFCPGASRQGKIIRTNEEQTMLLTLCVPRPVLVRTAAADIRSVPEAERQCLEGLIAHYGLFGPAEDAFYFAKRGGAHYFSREDWSAYLDFIDKKMSKSLQYDNSSLLF